MSSKSQSSPQPDYASIIAAQAAAVQSQQLFQLGQEQLAWAKEQYQQDRETLAPVIDQFIETNQLQSDWAKRQQDVYETTYRPLEEEYVQQAREWSTPQRQELEAGRAGADVASQFEKARLASAQQLRDFGVNPNSGRYASTDLIARTAASSAEAAAANEARYRTEMTGLGLKSNAINIGRGYPGAVATTYGTAASAGSGAIGGVNQLTSGQSQAMGQPTQYFAGSNQALGTWGDISTRNYSNYLEGYKIANQPTSSGIGSILGLVGGTLRAEGGGSIPETASPTQGAAVDDVPARLTAGEFVLPKRAVEWLGEKAIHQMIQKADKERAEIEGQPDAAVPEPVRAPPEEPTFVSRSAVPMR